MQRTVNGSLLLFLLVLLVAVSACSANSPELATADVLDTVPSIEATAEPTEAPKIPESFSSQAEILEANGYSAIQYEAGEWVIIDKKSGIEVVRTSGEGNLIYQTKGGDEVEVSQERFVVREVHGVGVKVILAIENVNGEIQEMFINEVGIDGAEYRYWVTPIEGQINPEVIENYTPIQLEDVWSGKLLYSELLNAQPFPEGTLVPDKFVYQRYRFPKGILVNLSPYFNDSIYKDHHPDYQEFLNIDNDYRRWVSFYKSQMPSGEEVIVATQQFLSTDGENSLFFHYVFGQEWPWERDHLDAGTKVNLIDSLFLATSSENQSDYAWLMVPAPYFEGIDAERHSTFFSTGQIPFRPTAGAELYENPRNDPLSIRPDLPALVEAAKENLIAEAYLADVGTELEQYQYILVVGHGGRDILPDYFTE